MPARPVLQPGERVLVSTRAHGSRLLRPFLVLLLSVFALSLAQRALQLHWRPAAEPWTTLHAGLDLVLLVAAAWVVLRRCLLPLLRWWRTRYVLTDRRLVLLRPGRGRRTVALPLGHLWRVDVECGRGPRLGRRDGRLVADFGPLGGLRLEHAPEARRFAELIRCAAGDAGARSAGGAPGRGPTRVEQNAGALPHPDPHLPPRRPWGRRTVHQEQE